MGKRRVILTNIRDVLNRPPIAVDRYSAQFIIKLFNISLRQKDKLPLFSVVTEPENITITLSGVSADRNLRLIIQGFLLSQRNITSELSSKSLLLGEDFVDAIVRRLLEQTSVDKFANAWETAIANKELSPEERGGCGFSVTAIGPIIVEEYALTGEYVYMSVPLVAEFLEN